MVTQQWFDAISTRRENSNALPTTTATNSQDAAFSSCLATIDDLEGRYLPLAFAVTRFCRLIYPVTERGQTGFPTRSCLEPNLSTRTKNS